MLPVHAPHLVRALLAVMRRTAGYLDGDKGGGSGGRGVCGKEIIGNEVKPACAKTAPEEITTSTHIRKETKNKTTTITTTTTTTTIRMDRAEDAGETKTTDYISYTAYRDELCTPLH